MQRAASRSCSAHATPPSRAEYTPGTVTSSSPPSHTRTRMLFESNSQSPSPDAVDARRPAGPPRAGRIRCAPLASLPASLRVSLPASLAASLRASLPSSLRPASLAAASLGGAAGRSSRRVRAEVGATRGSTAAKAPRYTV